MGYKPVQLYNNKVYISGNRVEIYKYNGYQHIGGEPLNIEGKSTNGSNKEKNRKTTLNKARNNIIRLVNSNPDMQTFITLTYKENMQDLSKSKKHVNYFFKKLSKDNPNLKYLYVLEYQERGAIHYHILCNLKLGLKTAKRGRKSKIQKEYEIWFAKEYWSNRGFVDVRNLESEGNTNAGKYIATYLVEDLLTLDLDGNRCYSYSRNLDKPIVELIDTTEGIEEIVQVYSDYEITYTSTYDIKYVDKKGRERVYSVNYYDMYKKEP